MISKIFTLTTLLAAATPAPAPAPVAKDAKEFKETKEAKDPGKEAKEAKEAPKEAPKEAKPEAALPGGVQALDEAGQKVLADIPTDPAPAHITNDAHFLTSNENQHFFWKKAIEAAPGGIFIGIGTDQNYVMAPWGRPEYLILVDFDQMIVDLHVLTPLDVGAHDVAAGGVDSVDDLVPALPVVDQRRAQGHIDHALEHHHRRLRPHGRGRARPMEPFGQVRDLAGRRLGQHGCDAAG